MRTTEYKHSCTYIKSASSAVSALDVVKGLIIFLIRRGILFSSLPFFFFFMR